MPKIFADVSEKEISRSIAAMFMETMNEYTDSDVIISGALLDYLQEENWVI